MVNPLVSIITPCYQAQATIACAVKSVLAQTYKNWEMVIISDDQCDYQALLRTQGIADPRLSFTTTGYIAGGISNARNTGLAVATGDVIATLDADDTFDPARLALMVPKALAFGVCTSAVNLIEDDTKNALVNLGQVHKEGALFPQEAPWVLIHNCNNVLIDKRQLALGWNTEYETMEDFLFMLSWFNYLDSVYYMPQRLYNYHICNASISNDAASGNKFVESKARLIQQITNGDIEIKGAQVKTAFLNYFTFALAVEKTYATKSAADPSVKYYDILQKALSLKSIRFRYHSYK